MEKKEWEKRNTGSLQPIRILKRQPNSDPCLVTAPSRATTPHRQIKTLEEREAAYAEARLRILGPTGRTAAGCDAAALPNGHQNRPLQNPGTEKFPAEPNIKIISKTIRQNANSKT